MNDDVARTREMFSAAELTTLRALINRIIPADEAPSGWDAGVGDYLQRQLQGQLSDELLHYQQGLAALDAEAQFQYGSGFATLPEPTQDALLQQLEQGIVQTNWPIDPTAFFNTAVVHTAEGFYSDPGNGGNHHQVAWQMIGYEVRG